MNVDLDRILIDLPLWDLTLTIDGQDCRVREVSEQELARFVAGRLEETPAALLAFVAGLFEVPATADVGRMTMFEALAVVAAVNGYWAERSRLAVRAAQAAGAAAAAEERRQADGIAAKDGE